MTVVGQPEGSRDVRPPAASRPGAPSCHPPVPGDLSIIAVSPSMRRAVELARTYAPTPLPVLLVGPTGTGKEVLAQAIHRWSARVGRMVEVNCGALPADMVIRELFGHRRGAFTSAVDSVPGYFEAADRGTLFLDELASMPIAGQRALLRVAENGEFSRVGETTLHRVSVRLLAAVQELEGVSGAGPIRADLMHRLGGVVIRLRALRERLEDLWPLAEHFARQLGTVLDPGTRPVLERHSWPGNVRELRHVMTRAATLQPTGALGPAAVCEALDMDDEAEGEGYQPRGEDPGQQFQRAELMAYCEEQDWNVERVAVLLGVHRATLYRRLKRLGIQPPPIRPGPANLG